MGEPSGASLTTNPAQESPPSSAQSSPSQQRTEETSVVPARPIFSTVAPDTAVEDVALTGDGCVSRPLGTVARSVPGFTTNTVASVARDKVPKVVLASETGLCGHNAAESCPPHTVVRSASPPPVPLSPRPLAPTPPDEVSLEECPENEGCPENVASSPLYLDDVTAQNNDTAPISNGSESLGAAAESSTVRSGNGRNSRIPRDVTAISKELDADEEEEEGHEGRSANSMEREEGAGGPAIGSTDQTTGAGVQMVKDNQGNHGIDLIDGNLTKNSRSNGIKPDGAGNNRPKSNSNVDSGTSAGGMPTWVVKPAANSNCGFGIQVCCSFEVNEIYPL